MKDNLEIDEKEKALLVGVDTGEEKDFDRTMEELGSLAQACHMEVAGIITQKLDAVNQALYIGSGKVKEVKEFALDCEAEVIIFDNGLTPSQLRNLNHELELPVLDRTTLILDIFALRARTREARLQVEAARLKYLLPRLVGMHDALSRQGGASGSMSSRGAGEKKLELDRRKIEHRISELNRELESVARERKTQRQRRLLSRTPQAALVGYTNAGKSTILNRMVELGGSVPEKKVLEKDMLFATLETNVRAIDTGDSRPFLLADTVGFIHKLPHGLIQAFQSTLEEVKYADLLIQVIDFSDDNYEQQMEVTAQTLKELEADDIPMIYVYNKADRKDIGSLPRVRDRRIYMSAADGRGIQELLNMIQEQVYLANVDGTFFIPYEDGAAASYLMEHAAVLGRNYEDRGVRLHVNCHRQDMERFEQYIVG